MITPRRGVPHIVQLDAETCLAYAFRDGSLIQTRFDNLNLRGVRVAFDTDRLFAELREAFRDVSA